MSVMLKGQSHCSGFAFCMLLTFFNFQRLAEKCSERGIETLSDIQNNFKLASYDNSFYNKGTDIRGNMMEKVRMCTVMDLSEYKIKEESDLALEQGIAVMISSYLTDGFSKALIFKRQEDCYDSALS